MASLSRVSLSVCHYHTGMSTYAFGDGDLAVERMGRVAEVFEGASARFLAASVSVPVGLAVDLGCGPGHAARLLAGTLRPARTVGLDASARMVQIASAAAGGEPSGTLEFLRHDVTAVPFRSARQTWCTRA